jgi:hypothetical protein
MTIPRQLHGFSYEALTLLRLDTRIRFLELDQIATGNEFFRRAPNSRSNKTWAWLRSLEDRTEALEQNTTTPRIDFDLKLPRRTPLGDTLFALHNRLQVLGN